MEEVRGSSPLPPTIFAKEKIMTEIIYENGTILAVNKPAGIVSEDLAEELAERKKLSELPRFGLAHRIDKGTSGVLLFGKEEKSLEELKLKFKERKIRKKYLALVWRPMKKIRGEIITSMRRSKNDRRKHQSYPPEEEGRRAVSKYEVLENFENYSLISVKPETGRRHQIRSQMAYIGHPIVGDDLYGFKDQIDPSGVKRLFLHSLSIEFNMKGKKRFVADPTAEFKNTIKQLRKCQKK